MIDDLLIVAAGMGTRLKAKGDLKPLVELHGKPMIEHAIGAAFSAGLSRATVVVGYNAPILSAYLKSLAKRNKWAINIVENTDYVLANGLSVLKARNYFSGPFCLAMCDHYVEPAIYSTLMMNAPKPYEVALAVDRRLDNPYIDMEDVTKVRTSSNRILSIGKELNVFDCFDTGVFAAGPALFDAIEAYSKRRGDFSISGGMKYLAQFGKAKAVDVGDSFWIDVDSPEMYDLAESWLHSNQPAVA